MGKNDKASPDSGKVDKNPEVLVTLNMAKILSCPCDKRNPETGEILVQKVIHLLPGEQKMAREDAVLLTKHCPWLVRYCEAQAEKAELSDYVKVKEIR